MSFFSSPRSDEREGPFLSLLYCLQLEEKGFGDGALLFVHWSAGRRVWEVRDERVRRVEC